MPTSNQKRLMTTAEVEAVYGISARRLINDRASGKGPPFIRYGRSCLYDREMMEQWIQDHAVGK